MRIIYLISSIFLLTLTGCYSIYNVSDFSSRDKFYEDFNNFARNKNVKVTLSNDSSFSLTNSAEIANDTLYYLGKEINSGNKSIAVSDIKELNYTSNDYKSASILLKNGESYRAKEIKMGKDSLEFAFTNEVITQNKVTSINNIQKISYKNHSIGSISNLGLGFCLGIAGGSLVQIMGAGFAIPIGTPVIIGATLGIILGPITGALIGYKYTYQFSP